MQHPVRNHVRVASETNGWSSHQTCLLCAVVPAQQAQIVDHSLWQEALFPELSHRCGTMPLGQLGLVRRQDE